MPSPAPTRPARVLVVCVLGAYLVALALIAFWPEHVDRDAGWLVEAIGRAIPLLADGRLEWFANVLLFVPFGALGAALLPRRPLVVIGIGLAASAIIELVQWTFPGRTSSLLDVLANTLGTAVGVGVVVLVRRFTPAADRR